MVNQITSVNAFFFFFVKYSSFLLFLHSKSYLTQPWKKNKKGNQLSPHKKFLLKHTLIALINSNGPFHFPLFTSLPAYLPPLEEATKTSGENSSIALSRIGIPAIEYAGSGTVGIKILKWRSRILYFAVALEPEPNPFWMTSTFNLRDVDSFDSSSTGLIPSIFEGRSRGGGWTWVTWLKISCCSTWALYRFFRLGSSILVTQCTELATFKRLRFNLNVYIIIRPRAVAENWGSEARIRRWWLVPASCSLVLIGRKDKPKFQRNIGNSIPVPQFLFRGSVLGPQKERDVHFFF